MKRDKKQKKKVQKIFFEQNVNHFENFMKWLSTFKQPKLDVKNTKKIDLFNIFLEIIRWAGIILLIKVFTS